LQGDYEELIKLTIPAVRAAIAKNLKENHKMNEIEIAKELEVTQAAVSKYLSGNLSKNIRELVVFINKEKLEKDAVVAILNKKERRKIADIIDGIATNKVLIKRAIKIY
jgi:predicted transcriptional regulator